MQKNLARHVQNRLCTAAAVIIEGHVKLSVPCAVLVKGPLLQYVRVAGWCLCWRVCAHLKDRAYECEVVCEGVPDRSLPARCLSERESSK